MGIPPKKREREVFVCSILLGVEQSWQGDFLFLARNFSWMHYAGAENRKGSKNRIENILHYHQNYRAVRKPHTPLFCAVSGRAQTLEPAEMTYAVLASARI
jgi:hypothetical protein